jgi:hypothetical protein
VYAVVSNIPAYRLATVCATVPAKQTSILPSSHMKNRHLYSGRQSQARERVDAIGYLRSEVKSLRSLLAVRKAGEVRWSDRL